VNTGRIAGLGWRKAVSDAPSMRAAAGGCRCLTSDHPVIKSRQIAFNIDSTCVAALITSGREPGCVVAVAKITLVALG
jgi:hypothetical protein